MSLSGDATEVQDENLLAAAVILRFYEELDATLVGIDDETYLRGTQVFLEAQASMAVNGQGLQNAAFWVGFRQEFHRAFIKQRPFRFDLSCCRDSKYKTLENADDFTWPIESCFIVLRLWLFAMVQTVMSPRSTISYVSIITGGTIVSHQASTRYTSNPPIDQKTRFSLRSGILGIAKVRNLLWLLSIVQGDISNFNPVTAIQHWHIARILLSAFDPTTPRMGPKQKRATTYHPRQVGSAKMNSRLKSRRMCFAFAESLAPTKQHPDSLLRVWGYPCAEIESRTKWNKKRCFKYSLKRRKSMHYPPGPPQGS
ncbi:uncharacterized protein N7496_005369 [Penicillium cataractarum]|uniref:Uncharacterized protein n=1 Tax=Penicillium cataractarum TaxID=2100454 RepID=A0A9W9SGI9_9EURO|nr:uncharacterized protein N7496_005369 [Penicillium cataractarum]KAJ5377960.1 hypothetical protein N7496_005369 [Penicillium cataractarum]